MAQYTMTIQQMININVNIFDFDYPIFNESYRTTFENLFIDHFLLDEIAHETIAQFKHRLKTKLNLIMPYYNKIYMSQELEQRILDNYEVTEIIDRVVTNDNIRNFENNNTRNSVNKNLYKDTPKTKTDISNFDIVTNLTKNIDDEISNNNAKENSNSKNIESYQRTMTGNIGVQTDADAIVKYWTSLRNVTLEIFENELSSLFMGVF